MAMVPPQYLSGARQRLVVNKQRFLFMMPVSVDGGEAAGKLTTLPSEAEERLREPVVPALRGVGCPRGSPWRNGGARAQRAGVCPLFLHGFSLPSCSSVVLNLPKVVTL